MVNERYDRKKSSEVSSTGIWLWSLLFPLSLAVYWLTSSVVLAALLPSIRAAVPTLQTGWWIRWYELNSARPIRGFILWWFYVADALWLASAASFMTVVFLVVIETRFGKQPDMNRFVTGMLMIVVGIGLNTLLGLYLAILAWHHSVRVWIHPKTLRWCQGNCELLAHLSFHPPKFNHAVFVLGTSLVTPGLVLGTILLIACTGNGGQLDNVTFSLFIAIMIAFFLVQPIVMIAVYFKIANRIIATNPEQCWGDAKAEQPSI